MICTNCEAEFNNQKTYFKHYIDCLFTDKHYPCPDCLYSGNTKKQLNHHIHTHHRSKFCEWQMECCEQIFYELSQWNGHNEINHAMDKFASGKIWVENRQKVLGVKNICYRPFPLLTPGQYSEYQTKYQKLQFKIYFKERDWPIPKIKNIRQYRTYQNKLKFNANHTRLKIHV